MFILYTNTYTVKYIKRVVSFESEEDTSIYRELKNKNKQEIDIINVLLRSSGRPVAVKYRQRLSTELNQYRQIATSL